jgi:hypothetical protein
MSDWQEQWEQHALEERLRMEAMPLSLLLEDIHLGRYGGHFGIWPVVAGRATLAEAGLTLVGVLERETDDLIRYHCAAALLSMLGQSGVRAADLCLESPGMPNRLSRLREELKLRLGAGRDEGPGS